MSAFVVSAYACFFAGAMGHDPAFTFCALLAFAASLAAAAVILNRHYERRARLPPAEMYGRPSYKSVRSNSLGDVASLGFPSVFYRVTACLACTDFGLSWTSFGRLRPLHTSAMIFAFGGNVLIATSFYVVQKTCRTRLTGDLAPWLVVVGYGVCQCFCSGRGHRYLFGATQSKEYAEPKWYADLWLTIVWVIYPIVFLATLVKGKEPQSLNATVASMSPNG